MSLKPLRYSSHLQALLHCVQKKTPTFVFLQKTKVQALGCREDMPLTIKVQGQDVTVVEEFVYLGSLIHSSTGSTCDISRRSAITRAAMQTAELRKSDLEVSARHLNEVEAVQHVHLTNIPVWFGLLGDI